MLTFSDFQKLAKNNDLNTNEKVGFPDCYRKDIEQNIFPDILDKLKIEGKNKSILDIGCGCSKPVLNLIEFSKENNHTLYLIDSKEMLDNLPDEDFIIKIICEFPNCKEIEKLINIVDYAIVYSVLHHIVFHSNYIKFIDTIIELLKINGRLLIADLPNATKKKRFLSSPDGIIFHQEWSNSNDIPIIKWNSLDKNTIDDGIVFSILHRYRNMGCETYLLEQKNGLPMNKTREDILIHKN